MSRLEYQHETIRDLIRNIPEEDLKLHVNPDKWSAFENIAHLTAYQPVFIKRLEKIQTEASPLFDRYVAEQDPHYFAALERPLSELLSDIEEKRKIILDTLKGMDDTVLAKIGVHPKYGQFTVKEWTEFFLLHESHHLYTIFMLVQHLHKPL